MGFPLKVAMSLKTIMILSWKIKNLKKMIKTQLLLIRVKKGPNQIWVIELTKANKFIIRNPESNKCFTAEGRQFYILTCDKSSKKQNFELGTPEKNTPANKTVKPAVYPISVPVKETPKTPKTNVKITAKKSFNLMGSTGLCIDAPSKIGERVTQNKCTSKKTLRWKFVPTKGGYVIKNNNDFVLENKESKKDDKNPIIANKGKKGPNQIWVIELTKANKFIIRNPETNKCFTAEGRLFYILTCDKSNKKQSFELGTPEKNTPANKTVKPAVYLISAPETVKPAVTPVPQTVKPAVTTP